MDNKLINELDELVARIKADQKQINEVGDPTDPRDIGTKVEIILSTFNADKPIDAKVDTGAEMSSIRVNNLKINEAQGVCAFDFYNKNITMSYNGFQSVKVGDATENRPLVNFNVTVPTKDPNAKDMTVNNVQFNLNEVQDKIVKGDDYMDVLLGLNFINAGKFKVVGKSTTMDPRESLELPTITMTDVVELMNENNLTWKELVQLVQEK